MENGGKYTESEPGRTGAGRLAGVAGKLTVCDWPAELRKAL
jgi:hypothetical protein